MVKVIFMQHDGSQVVCEASAGSTAMEAAIQNNVVGIDAECGGACSCATCHVYVDHSWLHSTGGPSPMEEDMLDFAADVRPSSRLSCQIKLTDALDGLILHVPETQG